MCPSVTTCCEDARVKRSLQLVADGQWRSWRWRVDSHASTQVIGTAGLDIRRRYVLVFGYRYLNVDHCQLIPLNPR